MPAKPAPLKGQPKAKALPAPARWLLLLLAVVSLALGVVGLFMPLLPTVPFLLLAAWAAGLSSPRLLHWLESHPHFGPPLTDWRRGGVVRRRAKWMATLAMGASGGASVYLLQAHWIALAAVAAMAAVLVWLWLRPEQAESPSRAGPPSH